MTKPTKCPVHPAKTPIRLGIRPVCSKSLYAQRVAKDPNSHRMDSEDSDQTGLMPRLIRVFTGCIGHFCKFCNATAHFLFMMVIKFYTDLKG